jgi:hypothetical protein
MVEYYWFLLISFILFDNLHKSYKISILNKSNTFQITKKWKSLYVQSKNISTLKNVIFEKSFLFVRLKTTIPNFMCIRWIVFEIQRSVSQWYLDFIYKYRLRQTMSKQNVLSIKNNILVTVIFDFIIIPMCFYIA